MRHSADAGLTLIEVLVALTLFAVISMAVLGMLPGVLRINSQTRNDQGVTVAAKQYLEKARAKFNDPEINPATNKAYGLEAFVLGSTALPAVPSSSEMNGYACTAGLSDQLTSPGSTGSLVMVRRLSLECTRSAQPTQTFVVDLGRPL